MGFLKMLCDLPWQAKSIITTCFFVFFLLMIPYVNHRYKIKVEALFTYYYFGLFVGLLSASITNSPLVETTVNDLLSPILPLLVVCIFGFVIGTPSNTLLGQSIPKATNPAIPYIIMGAGPPFAYVIGSAINKYLPGTFSNMNFSWLILLGILLVFVGSFIILGGLTLFFNKV